MIYLYSSMYTTCLTCLTFYTTCLMCLTCVTFYTTCLIFVLSYYNTFTCTMHYKIHIHKTRDVIEDDSPYMISLGHVGEHVEYWT